MPEHVVRNPGFEKTIRDSFARQGLMSTYAARLERVAPGLIDIAVPFADGLTQQAGYFHAGVTTAAADTACGYAALTLMAPGSEVLSVEFKTNLLAPARGDRIVARGRVVRSGRTITVCQADVFGVDGAEETHCATMVATMIRVDAG
ncbi:PaaI family thioesterase [Tomitella gaofuii]|uniref:PaaI family thioesterase n=1 Tax=Tomitella gaofuii TaxID=2760083 RepID=UPI0015FB5A93|nr:PaaI family thioesterase [Tomitella gaofuii]